ncbi:MAG: hypothetical protein AYL28_002870 [Candidatus Bathyarchaeota archaeon B23]|nr:MAG: hypothetical protein AYL28_002870 [Candidatus Bathyarchaeota archaeon B23]
MRRLSVYLLSVFIAFTLGYIYLHRTFMLIADWLTPILGYSFIGLLVAAYLLFADPLKYLTLFSIWFFVGFICGLVVGRRWRGISTALSVYSTTSAILILSGLDSIRRARELGLLGGEALSHLPPPPRGLTIAHILEAPVIGTLIARLMELLGGGVITPTEPLSGLPLRLVMRLLAPILVVSVEDTIILIVAALIGAEMGRYVEGRLSPLSNSIRGWMRGGQKVGAVALLLILPLGPMALGSSTQAEAPGFYFEGLIGIADELGSGYVMAFFADSSISLFGVDPDSPEAEGLIYALLLTQEGGLLPASRIFGEFASGLPLISLGRFAPPTLLLITYLNIPREEAEDRASTIASTISSTLGITLRRLASVEQAITTSHGEERLFREVYASTSGLDELSGDYLGLISSADGVAETIHDAFSGGALRPRLLGGSSDGILLFAGLIDVERFDEYVSLGRIEELGLASIIIPEGEGLMGVSGIFTYWRRAVHSPPELHTFDLGQLLGVEGLRLSSEADISRLLLTFLGPDENESIGKLLATVPPEDIPRWINSTLLSKGVSLDPSDLILLFEADVLPHVEVVRELSPTGEGGEVTVTITVINREERPIFDVKVEDDPGAYYPNTLLVLGSTEASWPSLEPNGSRSITYKLKPSIGGVYTLKPVVVQYGCDGGRGVALSDLSELRSPHKPPYMVSVAVLSDLWHGASEMLDAPTGGRGMLTMQLITSAAVGLLIIWEVVKIRRWLGG